MTSITPQESLGLIGLGLLGSAIAERLLASGYAVVGYDIDAARRGALQSLGGEAVPCATAVATACRVVVLSLPTSAIVWEVVQQLQPQVAKGGLIIDTTTGDPHDTERTAAWLQGRHIDYVDATIAGSSEQVRQRAVIAMLGGEPSPVARSRPILEAFSKQVFHVGRCGSGARMKLVVNLVLGLNRAVLAEALALANHCGMDPWQALEVLKSGAAYSAVMDSKGAKMINGDFSPQARLGQHLKDVRLIRELAAQAGARAPLSELHEQLLMQAVAAGYEEKDNCAIIQVFLQSSQRCSTPPT